MNWFALFSGGMTFIGVVLLCSNIFQREFYHATMTTFGHLRMFPYISANVDLLVNGIFLFMAVVSLVLSLKYRE